MDNTVALANLDQLGAMWNEYGRALCAYYNALIAGGLPKTIAHELLLTLDAAWWDQDLIIEEE